MPDGLLQPRNHPLFIHLAGRKTMVIGAAYAPSAEPVDVLLIAQQLSKVSLDLSARLSYITHPLNYSTFTPTSGDG